VSLTVTVNEQEAELPAASVAVQETVVVPFGNVEPEAGEQTTEPPGQLSETVGAKVTTAEHCPGVFGAVTLAGQTIDGGCVSLTVTVNDQDAVLLEASVAVQLTVVVPFGNVEPEAGVQTNVAPGQLSETVGA
jgi:predicted nucleotidyltransferase